MCLTQPAQQSQLFAFQTSTTSDAKAVPAVPDSMRLVSTAALAAAPTPFLNLERIALSPDMRWPIS
jgi:hypothetical protein